MIDAEFVEALQEQEAKGSEGVKAMREIIANNGGIKRLIALAAAGVGAPVKRQGGEVKVPKVRTRVPDEFPDADAKAKAIAYWTGKGRPDLVARVEEEAEKFHAHHLSKGTRSESWEASWRTWYGQALEFNRPPRAGDLFLASVTPLFQNTNVAGWKGRMGVFFGLEGETSGQWNSTWGLPPFEDGHKIPQQAIDAIKKSNPNLDFDRLAMEIKRTKAAS